MLETAVKLFLAHWMSVKCGIFWKLTFDVRTGIGKVQRKLSQKYVGLWPFFQELFFCTKLRIWLMVWCSDFTVWIWYY